MIEREALGRFLDLDDDRTFGKMPACRVPDVFEERTPHEQDEIDLLKRLTHLRRITWKRLTVVRMARRKRCVVPQALEPYRCANRLGQRDKCARLRIAQHHRRQRSQAFRFQEQRGDLLEAPGIRTA